MSSLNLKREQRMCRVCLIHDDNNKVMPVSCECSGSVGYIHEECFIGWVQHLKSHCPSKIFQQQEQNENTYLTKCEICGKYIRFEAQQSIPCNNYLIKQTLKRLIFPLCVLIFLILPMVFLIIFCGPDTYEGKVFIGAIIVLLLGIVILAGTITACWSSIKQLFRQQSTMSKLKFIEKPDI